MIKITRTSTLAFLALLLAPGAFAQSSADPIPWDDVLDQDAGVREAVAQGIDLIVT